MRLGVYCFAFLAIVFGSCSLLGEGVEDELLNGVTEEIRAKADTFLIAQVGKQFFLEHFSYQASDSRRIEPDSLCVHTPDACVPFERQPYYVLFYRFEMDKKPFIEEIISFYMDTEGEIITEREIIQIPNCVDDPEKCVFPIDEVNAISIALEAGLEEGIKPWEAKFHWHALGRYVWNVKNTLGEDESAVWGDVVTVNANTGEVIRLSRWASIID